MVSKLLDSKMSIKNDLGYPYPLEYIFSNLISEPTLCVRQINLNNSVVSENWIKQKGTYFLDKTNTHLTNIRWVGYFTIYLQNKE